MFNIFGEQLAKDFSDYGNNSNMFTTTKIYKDPFEEWNVDYRIFLDKLPIDFFDLDEELIKEKLYMIGWMCDEIQKLRDDRKPKEPKKEKK